jgi:hypothetical protein
MVKFSFRGMQDWVDSVDKETERRQDMAVKMMELDLAYGGGRSRSRSGTSGSSDQDIADKAAYMSQIKSRLPENSQIVPQLAGASLETLKKFASGQDALYKYHLKHDIPYTPQEAEEDVISFHRVVEEIGPTLSSDQIMTTLGLTEDMLDEEIRPNVTFRDAIKDFTTPSQVVGATFSFSPTPEPKSVAEVKDFQEQFYYMVTDSLQAVAGPLRERQRNNTLGEDAGKLQIYEDAITSLSTGDTKTGIQLAGEEGLTAAIEIMKMYPAFKNYRNVINKHLIFLSHNLTLEAYDAGLIADQDVIVDRNGQLLRVNEGYINSLREQND